jgi:asparagine synthase (glutamine-hydrolysing)
VCGICGIVTPSGAAPPDLALLRRMMGRLAHRGPDGSGLFRDSHAALGHTRLAIIDVAGGAQPLSNEEGSLWISFNGEIFNYVEIGAELARLGHVLRTKSDSEVIVHAFEQWGVGCFERFNGQWAIALWDCRSRRLVLSRDRMGVRPLFYTERGGTLLFASEIKAIFADPRVPRRFDPAGLAELFAFWCPVDPRTTFAGISELPPGHYAVWHVGRMERQPFWSLSFPPSGKEPCQDIASNGARLRAALVEATRLRFLRSDVPVGAYLSGGIDSSVTAAIIARYTHAPLTTFSLRFTDSEFDEGSFQQEMSSRLGTAHRSIDVSAADIGRVFPEVIWHAEQPVLRSAPAPLYLLSRLVRESGFKVVVTGEGSDEVLAGYDIFREAKVRQFWARDPASVKRARIAALLYPWMERSPDAAPAFAHAFFSRNLDPADPAISHRPRWDSTEVIRSLMTADMRAAMADVPVDSQLLARLPPEHTGWDPTCRAQWLEMTTLLPGYILSAQGDRMLMANSVEGRFPFLDRDVVDLANEMPARHKLLALDEKHILKREFADLLPPSILARPKQPYRAPDAASFFLDPPLEWVEEATEPAALEAAGIFSPDPVTRLMQKCRKVRGEKMSNTDNMRVLAVLSTMLVHRMFIAGDGRGTHGEDSVRPDLVVDRLVTTAGNGEDA